MEDENPDDVYIITEDPSPFNDDDEISIVNLRDLQRNIKNPASAPQLQIPKSDLDVIAESLEEYIARWNK